MTTVTKGLTFAQMRDARSLVREYGFKETLARLRTWAQDPNEAHYWKLVEQYLTERHMKQAFRLRSRRAS
jgi:hypothetical protein